MKWGNDMRLDMMPIATEKQIIDMEQAVRHIWIEYYKNIFSEDQIEYMLRIYHSKEAIRKQIQSGTVYMILMSGDETIGYTSYYIENDILYLPRLCIKHEYRRNGLARQVIERIEKIFLSSENGLSHIKKIQRNLSVRNDLAIHIYEHLGFYKKKRVVVDLGSGYFSEDYVMEKRIGSHEEKHRHYGTKTEALHNFAAETP